MWPIMSHHSNLEAALALVALGFYVFPAQPGGEGAKRPWPGVMWRSESTTDPDRIARWWRVWPSAAPAIDVGRSNLLIIDKDRHPGAPDGVTAWEALTDRHGCISAPVVRTPTTGEHVYLRQPAGEPLGNSRGSLPRGIDVRGAGGYVIGPGAIMADGRVYELEGDLGELIEPPAWLLRILRGEQESTPVEASAQPLPIPAASTRLESYAQTALAAELDRVRLAPKGQRNATLNTAAFAVGTLVGAGWLDEADAKASLEEAARECGLVKDDGLRQTRQTIASGLAAGKTRPREAPPDRPDEVLERGAELARGLLEGTQEADEDEPAPVVRPEYVEPAWCSPGGLLGEIADWIVAATPRRPNRPLAVAAAIATISTAMCRHLAGPTRLQSHLYIAAIGDTGVGKDWPLRAPGVILKAAGLGGVVTSGKFKSDVAIEGVLGDAPCTLAIVDEIGTNLFSRMSSRRGTSHESAISGVLRELWGAGFSSYRTGSAKGARSQEIEAPALAIFGASTSGEFYSSLSSGALDNGLLNRWLIIRAAPRRTQQGAGDIELPDSIPDALLQILPQASGNLSGGAYALSMRVAPDVDQTPWDGEVETAFGAFEEATLQRLDATPELEHYLARTPELALKLAHVHAVSRAGRGAVITLQDWEWGAAVASDSAEYMADDVMTRMASSEREGHYKLVLRLIKEAGVISRRDLLRRIRGRVDGREVTGLISTLVQSELVSESVRKSPKQGRPSIMLKYGPA